MNRFLLCWAFLLLAGCSETREPSDARLRVFNWTDYIGESTISSFEAKTGAEVTYDNYSANEELIAKLDTGAEYDVVFPSGYAIDILISKNLLDRIDKSKVPNFANVMPEFAGPPFGRDTTYCVPYTWSVTAIGYDSRKVSDEEARTFSVLFQDKYRGKILMLDDMRASLGMSLKRLGYSANSTDRSQIEKAARELREQKPLVHVYASSNLPQLLASGEITLAYAWSGDILQAASQNKNIKISIPDEGTIVYVDYMCIPASARSVRLAHRFIDHVLAPKVSLDIAATTKYATTNVRARALASDDLKKLWEIMAKLKKKEKCEVIQNLGPKLELYDEAWQTIKAD